MIINDGGFTVEQFALQLVKLVETGKVKKDAKICYLRLDEENESYFYCYATTIELVDDNDRTDGNDPKDVCLS